MYALTILVAAIGTVSAAPSAEIDARQIAQVASVDRYAGSGCTGTICVQRPLTLSSWIQIDHAQNIAGSGDLFPGCNVITDACQASLKLNYANAGCKGMFSSPFLIFWQGEERI
jgi:hypothetical protein